MNLRHRQATYPLGPVSFVALLAVYKAVRLTADIGADGYRFLTLLGTDAFFLALVFLIAFLHGISRPRALRVLFWLILICLTFFYLLDSFVLLALDQHVSLFEVGRYAPEWAEVSGFFNIPVYIAVVTWLVSSCVFVRTTPALKRIGLFLWVTALLAAGMSAEFTPLSVKRYAVLGPGVLTESAEQLQPAAAMYSPMDIAFYAGLKQVPAAIPSSKPDIILLVVESLSSINSSKTSGNTGFLDRFDELAEQGVLFRNFFANHQASEGGLIALLGGFPPMHFPTASPYMFDEFAVQASVIDEYRQQGYYTDFLTSADLSFIGLDRFLEGLGLDRSRGRDEVEAMRNAPRVVLDAPSDAWLYREALSSVQRLMNAAQPFLLTIATTSTHLPYSHPEGGPDTPRAVWEWSMQQLAWFYSQLSEAGFFDHGILLITGDHRQMRPLSEAEVQRYGGSARARVPLLVIGEGFPRGLIDERFFQQSDLLRMLGIIDQRDIPLSPHPIWVERYNRKYGHIELIDSLGVFDEADQGHHEYHVVTHGSRMEWLDGKPAFSRELETRIHRQRSLHQHKRSSLAHPPVPES
ncbi:MAG: sulfatase-like hydrolase/transferase [Lysobacterales bacterium]